MASRSQVSRPRGRWRKSCAPTRRITAPALLAALAALRSCEAAKGLSLGVIGYCMGGQAALEAARAGEDIVLAASFHGILATALPADKAIPARILVCHGDADPMVPREQVLGFWQEMDAVGANWHFHGYARVRHGFTDPGSDARGMAAIAYDASADRQMLGGPDGAVRRSVRLSAYSCGNWRVRFSRSITSSIGSITVTLRPSPKRMRVPSVTEDMNVTCDALMAVSTRSELVNLTNMLFLS